MGQGTLTGLAQLVAEELECDWNKVTWAFPTPGQNVARERIWRDFSTGGSQGLRGSQEYVRQGGAAARTMLIQAAANEWKVAPADCVAKQSVITHKPSGSHGDLRQGGRGGGEAADSREHPAQGSEHVDDRRQTAEATRHTGQADRQAGLRRRHQAAQHAERQHQGLPCDGRQAQELRRIESPLDARRQRRRQSRDRIRHERRCGRCRHLVASAQGPRGAAGRVGVRRERELRRCGADEATRKRPRRGRSIRRQSQRRREGGVCVVDSRGRGRVQGAVAESRDDGADERNRGVDEGPLRGLVSHAERRSGARGGVRSVGAADRAVRGVQDDPRRRLRPARRRGLRDSRPSSLRRRFRARRSSCCGRAKRTRYTASSTRRRWRRCAAASTPTAISRRCTCASRVSRSWPRSRPNDWSMARTSRRSRASCKAGSIPRWTSTR